MFIRSERLFLRPGWSEDWEELLERINDEAVIRNLAQLPWPYTAEAAREFAGLAQDRRHPHFLVTLPGATGARLVGCVGLAPARDPGADGQPTVELGYWIARPFWGRGFATEAARAALSIARTLGHRQVGAGQFIDNPASARVLHKLGFRPTVRSERYCLARGAGVAAQNWVRDIGPRSDCDRVGGVEEGMCAA